MTKGFDKIKEGLEDAIAFARGDESRGKLHTPEEIMQRRKTDKGLTAERTAKGITRSDLLEIIARAVERERWKRGANAFSGMPETDARTRAEETASAILAALSSAGLAVVAKAPMNHNGLWLDGGGGEVSRSDIYRAMVAAEDLTGERG